MTSEKVFSTTTNSWIICPNPNPQARLRLFCFPYAGGGAAAYHPWAKLLPSDVELYAIRLPGRESRMREAPYVRLAPLVEDLAEVLSPYLDEPFVFFGHSMGALIAFELARHLRRQNMTQPLHLFASGHRAPQIPDPDPPLYQLPDAEFVKEMRERYNGIPQPILDSNELLQLFLPVIRSDVTILDTYHYTDEALLECPISAYGGENDPWVSYDQLDAWRDQTQSTFSLRMYPGDHFYLQSAQASLLQVLTNDLARFLT